MPEVPLCEGVLEHCRQRTIHWVEKPDRHKARAARVPCPGPWAGPGGTASLAGGGAEAVGRRGLHYVEKAWKL